MASIAWMSLGWLVVDGPASQARCSEEGGAAPGAQGRLGESLQGGAGFGMLGTAEQASQGIARNGLATLGRLD